MTTYNVDLSLYITDLFVRQDETLNEVLRRTPRLGLPEINVKPEEGRFLQVLVRAIGARKALEIGTLGGYSGIWIARGLVDGGRLITLEKEPRRAEIAREHFEAAGVADRVEIRTGDAHATLETLTGEVFDFVFIDAEKTGYPHYYEWALQHTRPGGVIACHNAFRGGSVAGLREPDEYTAIMQEFNRKVASDSRVLSTIYPAGDGTVLAVKVA
ncbi:MAG: O-methyltransferase [Chloroflexi bacterium]|jgi:predicted O-methyltransferase YrrM|nr:O-methyltransferase [Chloroflexota bacterium]